MDLWKFMELWVGIYGCGYLNSFGEGLYLCIYFIVIFLVFLSMDFLSGVGIRTLLCLTWIERPLLLSLFTILICCRLPFYLRPFFLREYICTSYIIIGIRTPSHLVSWLSLVLLLVYLYLYDYLYHGFLYKLFALVIFEPHYAHLRIYLKRIVLSSRHCLFIYLWCAVPPSVLCLSSSLVGGVLLWPLSHCPPGGLFMESSLCLS